LLVPVEGSRCIIKTASVRLAAFHRIREKLPNVGKCWYDQIAALPDFLLQLELLPPSLVNGKRKVISWQVSALAVFLRKIELVSV
jgi:hypothetical protein